MSNYHYHASKDNNNYHYHCNDNYHYHDNDNNYYSLKPSALTGEESEPLKEFSPLQ